MIKTDLSTSNRAFCHHLCTLFSVWLLCSINPSMAFSAPTIVYDTAISTAMGNSRTESFGFNGARTDIESDDIDRQAREMDPNVGRFLQQDFGLAYTQQMNLYAFAKGDPINRIDPQGHISALSYGISGAVITAFGVVSNLVSGAASGDLKSSTNVLLQDGIAMVARQMVGMGIGTYALTAHSTRNSRLGGMIGGAVVGNLVGFALNGAGRMDSKGKSGLGSIWGGDINGISLGKRFVILAGLLGPYAGLAVEAYSMQEKYGQGNQFFRDEGSNESKASQNAHNAAVGMMIATDALTLAHSMLGGYPTKKKIEAKKNYNTFTSSSNTNDSNSQPLIKLKNNNDGQTELVKLSDNENEGELSIGNEGNPFIKNFILGADIHREHE